MSKQISGFITWLRTFLDSIYQDKLQSGYNIKTINNQTLLGSGNITVSSGSFDFDEIPQGDDLDNYIWEGAYFTNVYATISNVPVITPFVLTVDSNIGGDAMQTFYDLANNEVYTRTCYNTVFSEWKRKVDNDDLLDMIYPIGSIYMSVNTTNPSQLFGGTWEQIKDTFLLAKGDTYTTNGATGGASTVALTNAQMPRHTHTQNSHTHGNNSDGKKYLLATGNVAVNGTKRAMPSSSSSGYHFVYSSADIDIVEWDTVGSVTATNKYTGGSGSSESASNGSAHNNMPPYLVVNVWKRTA